MEKTAVEKRLDGARTEGHYVTPAQANGNGAVLRKSRTMVEQLDERCEGCLHETDCTVDRTCWRQEPELKAEVGRYRKREKQGKLAGDESDVDPVSRATGRAHAVGSGKDAHEWADAIQRLVDDADRPLEIRVPEQLHPANQRLMDAFGVTVIVDVDAPPIEEQHRAHAAKLEQERGRDLLDRMDAGEPVGLAREEDSAELRGRNDAEPSPSASPTRRARHTRETLLALVRAYAVEHGHPPTQRDLSGGAVHAARRIFGTYADLVVEAGFERPERGKTTYRTRGRRPKAAAPIAAPEQTPPQPDPPLAEVAQLEEHRPTLAGDAGPALRVALHGLLDSLRDVVDALLPDERS